MDLSISRPLMASFFTSSLSSSPSKTFNQCLLSPRGNIGHCGIRNIKNPVSAISLLKWSRRRTLICAVSQDAEESFKKIQEVDRLIDALAGANDKELQNLVVENVLAFDTSFWIRLAARSDLCTSEDDKKDYEELASSVMSLVDRLVSKTNEKIESSTDALKEILEPVVEEEEISWPPRDPGALNRMEEEVHQREREGRLDEGFLSEVNAQLRQISKNFIRPVGLEKLAHIDRKRSSAKSRLGLYRWATNDVASTVINKAKKDGDKPGLEAMLQKVFQLYASKVLSRRSYANKGTKVLKDEQLLEEIIKAPEGEWNTMLINGLTIGKGDISPEQLFAVIKKRIERTLIRTDGGSYEQRVTIEYLKGIQSRAEETVRILEGKPRPQ